MASTSRRLVDVQTVTTHLEVDGTSSLKSTDVDTSGMGGNFTVTGGGTVTIQGGAVDISGDISLNPTVHVDMNNKRIVNLLPAATASEPVILSQLGQVPLPQVSSKLSVRLASAGPLPTYTYNNGTSGVGATLTGTANGALSVDSVAVNANDHVLIWSEATSQYNGIYVVTAPGDAGTPYVLTRADYFDQSEEIPGAVVFSITGATHSTEGFLCITPGPVTVGVTGITFSQFTGNALAIDTSLDYAWTGSHSFTGTKSFTINHNAGGAVSITSGAVTLSSMSTVGVMFNSAMSMGAGPSNYVTTREVMNPTSLTLVTSVPNTFYSKTVNAEDRGINVRAIFDVRTPLGKVAYFNIQRMFKSISGTVTAISNQVKLYDMEAGLNYTANVVCSTTDIQLNLVLNDPANGDNSAPIVSAEIFIARV